LERQDREAGSAVVLERGGAAGVVSLPVNGYPAICITGS
jgi:hypothetical protein